MALTKSYTDNRSSNDIITILNGECETEVFDIHGMIFVGINLPTAFTSNKLFFQSSPIVNGDFQDLYNQDGERFTCKVAPERNVRWDAIDFRADRFLKIISEKEEIADRIITLQFAPR